jgi:hypothetical protein
MHAAGGRWPPLRGVLTSGGLQSTPYASILWQRLDRPGHEVARLLQVPSGWRLEGAAVFANEGEPCRLDYTILCDDRWNTRAAEVTGFVGHMPVETRVAVIAPGTWQLNGEACGDLAGCVDIDLNFSPCTNLLPIRRLNLAVGEQARVRAAWLRFPSFSLEPLEQVYSRVSDRTYRYESGNGRFVAVLETNAAGFVTEYPNFWSAEAWG